MREVGPYPPYAMILEWDSRSDIAFQARAASPPG
jgi:hypothetical protein